MNKNILIFTIIICLMIFSPPVTVNGAAMFRDIDSQSIHGGLGTIEFRVKLLRDISTDPHNHVLVLGVSSDASERYEVEIIKDKMIARRFFGRCLLTAFISPYDFKIMDWHDIKLTWNNASTKFYIDNREVTKIALLESDDIPKLIPCIRLGKDDNFEIDKFITSVGSLIEEDPVDREFVMNSSCPDLNELLNERSQEEYRGVKLHHFPDQISRDKVKSYIALLPEDFARSIKHVIFAEDERFKRGELGSSDFKSMSIMLKKSNYDDPNVFFHEAAHVYDFKLRIATGVPDDKSEWTAISGVSCYFKGTDMQEFAANFRETHVKNAFLGGQGGECPPEDLAEWVGAVYEYYIKNKTFKDFLDPSGSLYSDKNQKKLDFLLSKGFYSKEIYDKVIQHI
ncbi:MAG: hypothetical protein PHX78_04050 [bacterium]|nr:hypothetical protein [bacterium]